MVINNNDYCTNFDNIKDAYQYLSQVVNLTPILTSSTLNELTGLNLVFKCENFQKVGAFKYRGASWNLHQLEQQHGLEVLKSRGVAAHSSGNHAQAIALAAKKKGIPAYIVIPTNT